MKKLTLLGFIALLFCASAQAQTGKWEPLENIPDCRVWNEAPEPNDSATWSGVCRDGYAEGEGELVWYVPKEVAHEKHIYVGSMRRGKLDGRGIYTWPDGSRYDGMWKNDNWHGMGATFDANGNKVYEGNWSDNVKSGYGVATVNCPQKMPDGFVSKVLKGLACGMSYDGNWKDDLPNGEGTLITPYLGSYFGNWKNGCLKKFYVLNLKFGVGPNGCK
ncbi:hypothetical protein NBZ79_09385 [Sneathiella marina]|uniref:MORN repeat-containing protein n=1 Tax=Sneathiella marina TaxID=2950108 RepID=A0ABY4W834_9PROT|nr:hypothetical protein [Sneathiella marina]USG63187.1 hypothetical protein NBZ79_09385 [Sneathiella marina]